MLEALVTGFYNKLKGDVALQTKLGGGADVKIYHVKANQDSTLPYIVYGLLTDMPEATFHDQAAIENATLYINIYSKISPANITQIADLVFTALDNVSLTVTGYSSMLCMREYTGTILYDFDTNIYQLPLRYRVVIGKN